MSRGRAAAAGAAAIAALGVLAGTVVGGDPPAQVPGNPPSKGTDVVVAERVGDPPLGRPQAKDPRVFYYETQQPVTIQPGPGGEVIGKCPRGSIATNGYWYIEGTYAGFGLDDQGSSPAGFRRWAFYWENERTEAIDGVTLGMVCDRDG